MNRRLQWKLMDNYRRKLFLKTEIKKHLLSSLIKNQNIPITYRYLALWNKSKLSPITSLVKHQNRCTATGRIWGINKWTKYSRFYFRTESYKGNLPGFNRASW